MNHHGAKERIQAAGLAATKQRIALVEHLAHATKPLSAEDIAHALTKHLNYTTVYRALGDLVTAGLVRRIDFGENHARFELASSHHHHIVCKACGRVDDVTSCVTPQMLKGVLSHAPSFAHIQDHTLEFFGLCRPCARLEK